MGGNPSPNGYVPNVWGPNDPYEHVDLANNFDSIDANFDRLDQERALLGTVRMWYKWPGVSAITLAKWQSAGWQVCDGRQIGANDLGLTTTTAMPDWRYQTPTGAVATDGGGSPAQAYPGDGVAGTAGDGRLHAPGIGGKQGSNGPINVPSHYHWHNHIHEVGNVTNAQWETSDAQTSSNFYVASAVPGGSTINLSKAIHKHNIKIYSSSPRDPSSANLDVGNISGVDPSQSNNIGTSLQKLPTGGGADQPTGGSEGDNLTLSQTPATFGVLFMMKVRAVVNPTFPPPQ